MLHHGATGGLTALMVLLLKSMQWESPDDASSRADLVNDTPYISEGIERYAVYDPDSPLYTLPLIFLAVATSAQVMYPLDIVRSARMVNGTGVWSVANPINSPAVAALPSEVRSSTATLLRALRSDYGWLGLLRQGPDLPRES